MLGRVDLSQRPDLRARLVQSDHSWPRFLLHTIRPTVPDHELAAAFARFRTFFVDGDELVAHAHGVPLRWSGAAADLPPTWNAAVERAFAERARPPNALCLLGMEVLPAHQRRGLASHVLRQMKELAREHGLERVIAPVRPVGKSAHPEEPIATYVERKREDGGPADFWIRTHWRLGGVLVAPIEGALDVVGTVADWQGWCGRLFPVSDRYLVDGALAPVAIDRERNRGVYSEPAVWMLHETGR